MVRWRIPILLFAVISLLHPAQAVPYVEVNLTVHSPPGLVATAFPAPLATRANAACIFATCGIVAADVEVVHFSSASLLNETDLAYTISARVATRRFSHAVEIATPTSGFSDAALLGAEFSPALTDIPSFIATARAGQNARPDKCGDRILQSGEECDDGNTDDGDGCSSTCSLEAGYMCRGFVRTASATTLGVRVQLLADGTYVATNEPEGCTMLDICAQAPNEFNPGLWTGLFDTGHAFPPQGFYCSSFCDTFADPRGWELTTTGACQYTDIDECVRGLSICDFNAYCDNHAIASYNDTEDLGYSCRCDPDFFLTETGGLGCTNNGVDIVLTVAGRKNFDPNTDLEADRAILHELRFDFLQLLVDEAYTTLEIGALREACIDYPAELSGIATDAPFTGRGLWKLHVRIPSTKLNLAKLADGAVLHDYSPLGQIFDDATTADSAAHRLHTRNVCANDRARTCTADSDCLNGAVCDVDVPDIEVKVLSAGGALAPIEVSAAGMDVISVEYDIMQTGWWARVRYDNTVADTIDVLYLPHIVAPVSNEEFATFRHDEFACMPLGTGEFQQRRDNTVCCLQTLFADYTTTAAFEGYLNDTTRALGAALPVCDGDNTFPSAATNTLLDGSLDFVTGPFARMQRSYARLDTVETRGYQDLILFLAEEDMRALAGVESTTVGGYRLRFFIGMAHLQGLPITHLHASFSHSEVTTEITESYVFTTSSATEFSFVQHINVDLIQVRNESTPLGASSYKRFARVSVSVPPGTTADDVHGIVPFEGARVSIGFTQDTAADANGGAYYPCLDISRDPITNMLAEQEWCALQEPLCATLGPTPVTAGGQVYFIFPLRDDAWDRATMDSTAFFKPSLYLDFLLSTRDANGDRIMTRIETRTEINAASIASMCDETRLDGSLADIITLDMFMGLTPDKEQMEDTLLQSRDITRKDSSARHLERATSSVASNVLTLLVKGDPAVFGQNYASNYALEVEDMVTMHFLDPLIKAQVEALMASGDAFRKQVDSNSYTSMRIVPTDALLNLCPLQATRNVQGCIMRKEIEARLLDFTTQAIVGIAPAEGGTNAADVEDGASAWLQNLLGDSMYVDELGANHTRTMYTEFALNERYRKGFMVNPTIPWRQSQMTQSGFATSLDLAQDAISVVLVTLDKNIEAGYAPMVQLSLPATLQVPADELRSNQQLQEATEASYADAANVAPDNVEIDIDSIQDTTPTSTSRRLLQVDEPESTGCKFDVKISIDVQDEEIAMTKAQEIREEAMNENSQFTKKLVRSVNRRVRAVAKKMPPVRKLAGIIPPDAEIKAPVNLEKCYDDESLIVNIDHNKMDIKRFLGSQNNNFQPVTALSCTKRWVRMRDIENDVITNLEDIIGEQYRNWHAGHKFEVQVGARGPVNDGEWLQLVRPRGGNVNKNWQPANFAGWHPNYRAGHLWWVDFCSEPPSHMTHANNPTKHANFMEEWNRIRSLLQTHCCICKENSPKIPGTSQPYLHKYSWMYDGIYKTGQIFHPSVYENGELRTTMWQNFQYLQNYKDPDTGAVQAGYDAASVPAPPDICGDGEYWQTFSHCAPCPLGTYKTGGSVILELLDPPYYDASMNRYIMTRRQTQVTNFNGYTTELTACTLCGRGMTTEQTGKTQISDCVCARGHYRTNPDATECDLCPRNTYKAITGDSVCTPCPTGLVSRQGATSAAHCTTSAHLRSAYEEKHAYESMLGLLSFATPVDPSWVDPAPFYTSNDRRCTLLTDDRSVSCPDHEYPDAYPIAIEMAASNHQFKQNSLDGNSDYINLPFMTMHPKNREQGQRGHYLSQLKRVELNRYHSDQFTSTVNGVVRDDFAETLHSISIWTGYAYEGPSPAGFVEEIFPGQSWPTGTVINYRLRGMINEQYSFNVVTFISNKRLDESAVSTEFRFILCTDTRADWNDQFQPYFCRDEADPNDPTYQNQRNPHVLDGAIFSVRSFQRGSCFNYNTHWWAKDCADIDEDSDYNKHFDGVKHWRPFPTESQPPSGPYYLYTSFHMGPSVACGWSACVENKLYATYPDFDAIYARRGDGWLHSYMTRPLTLLPGTEITYGTPLDAMDPANVVTSAAFGQVVAVLSDENPPSTRFPGTRLLDSRKDPIKTPTLAADERACYATGTDLDCAGTLTPIFDEAVQAHTELDTVLPAPHLVVAHDPACGSVPYVVDEACPLTKVTQGACADVRSVDALLDSAHADTLQLTAPPVDGETRYTAYADTTNWASTTQGSTCSSSPTDGAKTCENALTDTATDAWPLPTLTTSAYTYSTSVVQGDDGWEFGGAGGWCPNYDKTVEAYLELDLGTASTVSGVAVQTRGLTCCYSQFFTDFAVQVSVDGEAYTDATWRDAAACPCEKRVTREYAASDELFFPSAKENTLQVFRGANTTLSWNWQGSRKLLICAEVLSTAECHAPYEHAYTDEARQLTHVFIPADYAGGPLYYYNENDVTWGINGIVEIVDLAPDDNVCAPCTTHAAPAVLAGVVGTDPAVVGEHTLALFSSPVSARYVRILPQFRDFGCMRVSAVGALSAPDNSEASLVFAPDQTGEAFVAAQLAQSHPVAWVQVFVPPGAVQIDVLLGENTANPLSNPVCGTNAVTSPPQPAYRVQNTRDVVAVPVTIACRGSGSVVVVKLPLCANGATDNCNPGPLPTIHEIRVLPPQAVFAAGSRWSWSHAEQIGKAVAIGASLTLYDPYTRPNLEPPTTPGVRFTSLADVHRQWCGVRTHNELWLHLDLGTLRAVAGFHLQSIHRHLPWRRTYLRVHLSYSASAVYDPATATDGGFLVMTDETYAKWDPDGATSVHVLSSVLRARHVRFSFPDVPHACLRVGLLDCRFACTSACVPGGVKTVTAVGGFALPLPDPSPTTLLRVPASDPASKASVPITFATLDPTATDNGYSVQITDPIVAAGDRLFDPANVALVNAGMLRQDITSPFVSPDLDNVADITAGFAPFRRAVLWRNTEPARSPFAAGNVVENSPDPSVHTTAAIDSGIATGIVLDTIPGRVTGLHKAVPKDEWRNTPVLRAQVEAGILGSVLPETAGTCVQPEHIRVDSGHYASGIFVNRNTESIIVGHMYSTHVQVYKEKMMRFMDRALGGIPTETCTIGLTNQPCVLRENDHLRPAQEVLGSCPPTARVQVSAVVENTPSAAHPVVVEVTNDRRFLDWDYDALQAFVADGYGGFPTTICNMPIDNAPCVLGAGDHGSNDEFDCGNTVIIGDTGMVMCPAFILPVYIWDSSTESGTDYLVRVHEAPGWGWLMWPVSENSIRTQPSPSWSNEQKKRHIFAYNPFTCEGCEICSPVSIVASSSTGLVSVESLRCDNTDIGLGPDYYYCPAYVFTLYDLDPTAETSTAFTVRVQETPRFGWVIRPIVDNNLRTTINDVMSWGDGRRGHFLYGTDPLASGISCTVPELTAPRASALDSAVHMALLIADHELAANDFAGVFCGRYRGSLECDIGERLDADSGVCTPCGLGECTDSPVEYSLCTSGTDPDSDGSSLNVPVPGVLSGIVAQMGSGSLRDPCSHIHPRATVLAIDNGQNTRGARACCTPTYDTATRLDVPGRVAYIDYYEAAALWGGADETNLPVCVQSISPDTAAEFLPIDGEAGPLPCRTDAKTAFPVEAGVTAATQHTIFARGFVLGRGAVLLAIDAGDVISDPTTQFRQRRVAEAFAVITTDADFAALNANIPNSPHAFAVGDSVFAWGNRAGGLAETCLTDPSASSRRGVTQWVVPSIDLEAVPGDNIHLYQLFLVGDSVACREHQCVEADALAEAPAPHAAFANGRQRLALLPGTGLWLDVGKRAPFSFADACLHVDFASLSRNGAFFEVMPHAVASHLGGQSFTDMRMCEDEIGAPCQYADSNTGFVWFHMQTFEADGVATGLVALRTDLANSDPDAASTVFVGYDVSAVGVATEHIDASKPARQTGDVFFLTDARQCSTANRRRRRLDAPTSSMRSPAQIFSRRQRATPSGPPALRLHPAVAVHKEAIKARLEKKRARESALFASRRLLQTTQGDETASTTTIGRSVLGIDNVASVLDAVCDKSSAMCTMLEVEVRLPSSLYCMDSSELIANRQTQLQSVLMRASGNKLSNVRVTSVYRPKFLDLCINSAGGRRLLATAEAAQLGVVAESSTNNIELNVNDADVTLAGIIKIVEHQAIDSGTRLFSICVGDSSCQHNATMTVAPPKSKSVSTSSSSSSSDNANIVMLIVVISVIGVGIIGIIAYGSYRVCCSPYKGFSKAPMMEAQFGYMQPGMAPNMGNMMFAGAGPPQPPGYVQYGC